MFSSGLPQINGSAEFNSARLQGRRCLFFNRFSELWLWPWSGKCSVRKIGSCLECFPLVNNLSRCGRKQSKLHENDRLSQTDVQLLLWQPCWSLLFPFGKDTPERCRAANTSACTKALFFIFFHFEGIIYVLLRLSSPSSKKAVRIRSLWTDMNRKA